MLAKRKKTKTKPEHQPDYPAHPLSREESLWAAAALLLPLVLFALTFCRAEYWGDATELALVARSAGIAHPTGYPLWSMIAALFARLPLPGWNPALAVNLLSALFGAGACLVLYTLQRRLGSARAAALFGALVMASGMEMWHQSSIAEVYSFHVLLIGGVLLAAVRFYQLPCPARLYPVALLLGLALSNHMTSVLLFPPVALLLFAGNRGKGGQRPNTTVPGIGAFLKAAGFLLLGLLPYLYLPLRSMADPWPDYGNPETWEGFRWLVGGNQFQYLMFSSGAGYAAGELKAFFIQLPRQFSPWLLALAPVGAVYSWSVVRRRVPAAAFAFYILLVTLHAVNYRIEDKEAYFLPVYLVLSLWIGCGAEWTARGAKRLASRRINRGSAGRLPAGIVAAALALLLLYQGISVFSWADRRTDHSLGNYVGAVIGSTEPGALLICGDFNVYSAYLYGSLVRGDFRQNDCVLDYLFPFPWYLEQLPRISPGVVVPSAALEAARRDWNRKGGGVRGLEHGRQKEQVLIEVKRLIIEANLPRRPVYLHMRDDTTMKESWAGLYLLEYRGLTYRVVTGGRQPVQRTYPADYPFFDRAPGSRRRPPHPYQLAANHKFSDAANRLGVILASAGRLGEALDAFDRALRHDPENFGILRNRGLLRLELLGDLPGARADFSAYLDGWHSSGEKPNREIMAIQEFLRRQSPPGRDAGR